MRAGGRDALVLVVDACRGAERLLQAVRPEQRRRPPLAVHVEDAAGDVDVPLGGDLLHDQVHREQRREVVRARPGSMRPGCSGGGGGDGRSAMMLYQVVGIWSSLRTYLCCRMLSSMGPPFALSRVVRTLAPRLDEAAGGMGNLVDVTVTDVTIVGPNVTRSHTSPERPSVLRTTAGPRSEGPTYRRIAAGPATTPVVRRQPVESGTHRASVRTRRTGDPLPALAPAAPRPRGESERRTATGRARSVGRPSRPSPSAHLGGRTSKEHHRALCRARLRPSPPSSLALVTALVAGHRRPHDAAVASAQTAVASSTRPCTPRPSPSPRSRPLAAGRTRAAALAESGGRPPARGCRAPGEGAQDPAAARPHRPGRQEADR